jgi:hypothetical protein
MNKSKTIGRSEKVDFPLLEIENLKVKVDTGAFTSSIHCSTILKIDDHLVRCVFLDPSFEQYTGKEHVFEILKEVDVKSSNGYAERRFMIRTKIQLLDDEYDIDLTLTHRHEMKYPALIGRKFLHGRFLVDVDRKYQ